MQEKRDRSNEPKCYLLRSREGTFFEIPVEIGDEHVLPAEFLQEALDYYDSDADDVIAPTWSKMTWGIH